jgi:hypothetical protein
MLVPKNFMKNANKQSEKVSMSETQEMRGLRVSAIVAELPPLSVA